MSGKGGGVGWLTAGNMLPASGESGGVVGAEEIIFDSASLSILSLLAREVGAL